MTAPEQKLFILDLLKLNKSEKMYSEESVINIIKQVLKMGQPVTAKTEQSAEEILKELKEFNPYPESVFTPIPQKELRKVIKLLRDNGYSTDCLWGNWGRAVWSNCVKKAEELFEQYASQKHEVGYPPEFVRWVFFKNFDYYDNNFYEDRDGGVFEFTLPELFKYWEEHINIGRPVILDE